MGIDSNISNKINLNGEIYYFFISISDLFNSSINKNIIHLKNSQILPFDINAYSEEWKYLEKNFMLWFIELNVPFFVNDSVYFSQPLSNISIQKFMFSKYLTAFEYGEEYKFLLKAKILLEHKFFLKKSLKELIFLLF